MHTISYVHDAASQLTSVSDAFSAYAFSYNAAGWLTSEDNSGTPGVPNVVLTHGYNAFRERTSRSDNLGGSTAFTFDQAHRMTGATLSVGSNIAQVAWTYDNAHRVTRITRNGMGSEVWTDITLDNMDRVKRIAHSSYAKGQMTGNPALSAFDYTWNAASEITSYTGPEGTLNYSYDTTSQLTGASGARSEAYGYDLNGNRTMAGYSTGTGNRLLTDGVYNYTHDNEGNLTVQVRISDSQRTEFTWDHRNRLTKVLVKDSGGTTIREARFTYDVFDRLIGRWIDSDGSGPQAAVQTWHAYDGANPYADFNSAGSLTNRYFYAAGIDELMGRMSASGVVDWYMPDLIGSVRQIVNKMGTSTLYTANYDSFGNIASQSGTGDRFKYAAREWEAAIDQYHNRARWYDPRVGRFTSEDPIGFNAGDPNLMRYVHNNPIASTDPRGLEELDVDPDFPPVIDIYIDGSTMPPSFDPVAVDAILQGILDAAGIPNQVVVQVTSKPPDQLAVGYTWDTYSYYIQGGWWNFNPFYSGVVAPAHDIWMIWGASVLSYGQYVTFGTPAMTANNPLGQAIGYTPPGSTTTTIYPSNIQPAMENAGQTMVSAYNYDMIYANVLFHEVFWAGLLGNADDNTAPDNSLPSGAASHSKPLALSPDEAADIADALDTEINDD
ncbi:MAG: RHS repeat-associated core domain-containing protein [Pirellulales bacterium]